MSMDKQSFCNGDHERSLLKSLIPEKVTPPVGIIHYLHEPSTITLSVRGTSGIPTCMPCKISFIINIQPCSTNYQIVLESIKSNRSNVVRMRRSSNDN